MRECDVILLLVLHLESCWRSVGGFCSERCRPKNKEVRKMSLRPFGGRGFYDPYHEMNRLLDEMLGGTVSSARKSGRQQGAATEWAPALDALTKDSDLVIRAELPGVKPEDVDISLHDNVLTISGERRDEQEEERGGYHIRERRYGSFRRSVALPEGIDESKISARYEDGVLEVTVQGAAVAREPKRIQIQGPSGERSGSEGLSS
jgi:HSP20 family protein